ncbi:P2Y purinoceptor 12-like [Lineus longissimus]|uniref:P2Y purinoceptor 12-like n=1 Tax=Lineus longissimus TaxID=88925 RepID=UPI00315D422E
MATVSDNVTAQITVDTCPARDVYLAVFYIYIYLISPTNVVGLCLNSLCMVIFHRMKSKMTYIYLLKALALSDISYILVCFMYFTVRHLLALVEQGSKEVYGRWDPDIGPVLFYATGPLYYVTQHIRNWLTVLISIDRFIHLVFPMWAIKQCTKKALNKWILLIVWVAMACNLPRYAAYFIIDAPNACKAGEQGMAIEFASWMWLHNSAVGTILIVVTPLIILYVMNSLLIFNLRQSASKRMTLRGNKPTDAETQRQQQQRATTVVISVAVIFTFCETPGCMHRLAILAGVNFEPDDPFFNYALKIALWLTTANSAMNFFAYVTFNKSFRKTLRDSLTLCAGSID